MRHDYPDIRRRIADPILWYDSDGCPRYDSFAPGLCTNIYAREVALVEIACQACGERFQVEMHTTAFEWGVSTIAAEITGDCLHYGDPPFHPMGGQCSGTTMNCDDLRVLEYWVRERFDWERKPEFEMALERG
ncbi:MAG: hypothetical protein V1790_17400 [Planctomycetota bacterium]